MNCEYVLRMAVEHICQPDWARKKSFEKYAALVETGWKQSSFSVRIRRAREPEPCFRILGNTGIGLRGLCVRLRLLLWRSLLARVLWVWHTSCAGILPTWKPRSRNPLSEPSSVC